MQTRFSGWLGALAAAFALGACASLAPVQTAKKMIGQPESAVRATFGAPTETYQLAGGTQRWIYSKQPMGHEVYAADFDASGKLTGFRQMLTELEIYQARPGVWTKHDVAEHFGMPREPTQYYPLMKREAWSYRMYTSGFQQAHFNALFDDNGVLDRTMIVVDPLGGNEHDSPK
ncbi:hypothetical protein DEE44_12140 [Ralstonia pickettii]|jgi:hypothetical protein|uniref:hypothetical protein n=1 Tax=Ralstonia pickettii TaxID=329 RepID=UPI0015F9D848|nr:hypothetical protein [Ralstonia pickettii]MBA9883071.1 hypothetical protein [Ralstonia pickettii]MBA9892847.1 hypothetical protein [Ralstonia pickettii]MBA9925138.1 hypothetical protein [Ralstonia pickettii]MBB0093641.1 hypothetical protein [Ralstonia pickettii]MBB0102648.1 hypothetical protein [Ralstonia pickettii]